MTTYQELENLLARMKETHAALYDFGYGTVPCPHVVGELQLASSGHRELAVNLLVNDQISEFERRWAAHFTEHGDNIWLDDWFTEVDLSPWPELLAHGRCLHALRVAFTKVGAGGLEGRPAKRPWTVWGEVATDDDLRQLIARVAETDVMSIEHGEHFVVVQELASLAGCYVELAKKIVSDSEVSSLEEEWVYAPVFIADPIWVTGSERRIDLSAWPQLLDFARLLTLLARFAWARFVSPEAKGRGEVQGQ
jgi:hypothetical protein